MAPTTQSEDLAKKFGLDPITESVRRLTQMIAQRDASTEDFARLISEDNELVARLLHAANPRAASTADYTVTTVEQALQRTGMSSALLLAMSDPLVHAVHKTFQTMLGIEVTPLSLTALNPLITEHVLGEVTFVGKATGLVHLRLPYSVVPLIGERLLGLAPADLEDLAVAYDVIGELCNMISGNFKSKLCDAGLNCKLFPPKIARTAQFKLRVVYGGISERHGFRAKELDFFTDLSINPWGE